MIKRMCIVDTVYTLLLYYLICGINEEDIFVISGGIPKEIRKNIDHIYFPHFKHSDLPDSNLILITLKRLLLIIKRTYGIIKLRIILFFKTRNCEVEVYGHGHLNFSFPFYEYENSYIIEDGLGNYMELSEPDYSQPILLKFLGVYTNKLYEGFGTHKNIKKVYLTKNNAPQIIKNKTEVINIQKIWNDIDKNEKNEILEIFNINLDEINFNDESVLILTEPLTEDKFLSLEDELTIYKDMIEKFNEKNIIIKPHPRDSKNYYEIFPNIKIINKYFPIELLNLIGIEPSIACSVVSTALMNFKKSKIYVYEGELKNEKLIYARNELIKIIKKENMKIIY